MRALRRFTVSALTSDQTSRGLRKKPRRIRVRPPLPEPLTRPGDPPLPAPSLPPPLPPARNRSREEEDAYDGVDVPLEVPRHPFEVEAVHYPPLSLEAQGKAKARGWTGPYPWDDHVTRLALLLFGHDTLRQGQREAINAVLGGAPVLALLPSGGGKSLLYQLPAVARPGLTLVVAPLLALVQDQMTALHALGVPAAALTSAQSADRRRALLSRLAVGGGAGRKGAKLPRILFVTPETLSRSHALRDALGAVAARGELRQVVVDEAHCISEWGHDFRPDYRRLGVLRELFPSVPVLALSGTCTREVERDVVEQLGLVPAQLTTFRGNLDRPHVTLEVRDRLTDPALEVASLIRSRGWAGLGGLVYCLTRREAERVAGTITAQGLPATAYHSRIPAPERRRRQEEWQAGRMPLLCTTPALGLGVDKSDVRYVVHTSLPTSLEAYAQHVGRAGRDGRGATAVLLFAPGDRLRAEAVLAGKPSEDSRLDLKMSVRKTEKLDDMVAYCLHGGCRRAYLMQYFDQPYLCRPQDQRCAT